MDALVREHPSKTTPQKIGERIKIVTHYNPDTDAWMCLWAAVRFRTRPEDEVTFVFIPAGEQLPVEEALGFRVIHMDTGKGEFDQHGKGLVRASSFQLLVEGCPNLKVDRGLDALVELSRATDNVEVIPSTSIHYYFKGLTNLCRDSQTKEVDWKAIQDRVFEVLDVIYSLERQKARSREEFDRIKDKFVQALPNGLKVAVLDGNARLREAAYDDGCHVCIWFEWKDRKRDLFHVGIQVKRNWNIFLDKVVAELRLKEAKLLGKNIGKFHENTFVGQHEATAWYLHDSRKLIVCGSRGHPLADDEFTKILQYHIIQAVRYQLKDIVLQDVAPKT